MPGAPGQGAAVLVDDTTVALRLLVDRRDELGHARTEVASRIHHLLLEIIPGFDIQSGAESSSTSGPARAPPQQIDH